MNKNLHIVPNDFCKCYLREALDTLSVNDDILVSDCAFQYEALCRDFSENELLLRSNRLKSLFGPFADKFYYYKNMKTVLDYSFEQYDKIVVWHGNISNELLNLYFLCKVVDKDIYCANTILLKDRFSHLPKIHF